MSTINTTAPDSPPLPSAAELASLAQREALRPPPESPAAPSPTGEDIGTTPGGAQVRKLDQAPPELLEAKAEGDGWASRKVIISTSIAVVSLIVAVVGGLVLGQVDATGIWHGRLTEDGMIRLVRVALEAGGIYVGINVVEKAIGPIASALGRKP